MSKFSSMRHTAAASTIEQNRLIPAHDLRRILGISAPTLWRWRHDESSNFPTAKVINGRLYFPWPAVRAWLQAQKEVA
jgi:predicted DNA-binding transcriptional regulator AlpA